MNSATADFKGPFDQRKTNEDQIFSPGPEMTVCTKEWLLAKFKHKAFGKPATTAITPTSWIMVTCPLITWLRSPRARRR